MGQCGVVVVVVCCGCIAGYVVEVGRWMWVLCTSS